MHRFPPTKHASDCTLTNSRKIIGLRFGSAALPTQSGRPIALHLLGHGPELDFDRSELNDNALQPFKSVPFGHPSFALSFQRRLPLCSLINLDGRLTSDLLPKVKHDKSR